MQLPAISAARRLGCTVHVADADPQCPGASRADRFHPVDLQDREGLLLAAEGITDLAGVFTAGTDFSASVAYVAERMGLPGIPFEAALDATDKSRMRAVLRAAGVAVPRFVALSGPEGLEQCRRVLRCPLVVKPVDNMGARGVVSVSDWSQLPEAVQAALPLSRTRKAIVEEFIPGKEYSLDAIVLDGQVHVTGVAERHIFFPPCFVEMGHTIPATLREEDRLLLERGFAQAIDALGIVSGAAKGDLFLDHSRGEPLVVVGEVAARLSGGYMSGWTYPLATGVPLTEIGVRVALGEKPPPALFRAIDDFVVAERALISCPGTVTGVEIPEGTEESVDALFIRCKPGDRVRSPLNNVEKVANAIARGGSMEEAERRALAALDRILIRLAPGDAETDRFLFSESGAHRFARYRVRSESAGRSLSALPPYRGDPAYMRAAATRGEALVVLPPEGWGGGAFLEKAYPTLPAREVLGAMVEDGLIGFAENDRAAPALGSLFWNAFIAAGKQGVVYLLDTLSAGLELGEDR
ncbi:MAG: ATP-grasp domain-containing protein [Spirochaetaceae bacterium]|nr:MAG: ATP-grasp domain-containing protein [Spirochaetaceae bacterium]